MDDIDQLAARTGRETVAGAIRRADGSTGSWRTISNGDAPWLPFFIAYDGDPAERRASWARRRAEAGNERFGGFVRVQVGGDEAELRDWLGEGFERLPVEVVAGEAGLRAVAIASPGGEVVLSDRSATGWPAL